MKKFLSLMLCVVMLASLIVPARAADAPRIIFTEESDYEPGFTVEVDTGATLMSCCAESLNVATVRMSSI